MSTVNWKSWPLGAGGAPTWPAVTGWLCSWMVLLTSRRRQPIGVELLRVEPDAHRVLADAQHLRVADARQARQLVDQVDGGVVRHVEAVEGRVRRGQRHDLQDRGRLLLHDHALRLDGHGQRGQRRAHLVLHQHLREIEVGADGEGHGERVGAGIGAVRLHVDHAFDAVDLQLDGQRHVVDDGLGAGARVGRRHLDGRRHDVGILGDRQGDQRDGAQDHDDDRQHIGQDRPIDEKLGNHRCGPAPTWSS